MKTDIQRLRAEFLEMPGMRLTAAQVQRLCGVESTMCASALDALVSEGFLVVSADGRYARQSDNDVLFLRPAKAELTGAASRRHAS